MKLRLLLAIIIFFFGFSLVPQAKDISDPRYPQRQYRRFVLPNQMKVFLISDPTINYGSAGLSVRAGSLNDPPDQQGMAHFLEHMLFLGTKKYPEVDDYQNFISNHDGRSNAVTDKEFTNYYFQISSDYLEEGLDRFAQFFIAPLFNPEYVKREMNAVHAEYLDKRPTSYWRVYQVEHSLFAEGHPERTFRPGNLDTLGDVTQEALIKFYRSHYSANLMNLVVLDKADLDTLQKWVTEYFSEVPNYHLPIPKFPRVYLPKSPNLRVVRIKPLKDIRTMRLTFPLPSLYNLYESKPQHELGHLLGHEGPGSLLSQLKKEGLVTGLSAGGQSQTYYGHFRLTIQLTPKGVTQYKTIITRVFQYIRLLRNTGLPKYVFDENRQMSEIEYRFAEKWEGTNLTSGFATLLHFYPMDVIEKAPFLFFKHNPHDFDSILYRLMPDNMLVTLIAQNLKTDKVEPYFLADYSYEEGDAEFIKQLQKVQPHPQFHLPEENRFIPQNLDLVERVTPFQFTYQSFVGLRQENLPDLWLDKLNSHKDKQWASWASLQQTLSPEAPEAIAPYRDLMMKHALILPKKLIDTVKGQIWFQQDLRFNRPKAQVTLRFHTTETYRTARHAVLSQLYAIAIEEGLNEFGYAVRLAGLDYGLGNGKKGITVNFSGFSDRILKLSQTIIDRLENITISPEAFRVIQERQFRRYRNMRFDSAVSQAFYQQSLLLEDKKHSIYQYQDIVKSITLDELKQYAKTLLQKTYIQGVVVGNLEEPKVKDAMEAIFAKFDGEPLAKSELFVEDIVLVNDDNNYVFSKKADSDNSAIVLMVEIGKENPRLSAATEIISTILGSRMYTELRTKQQLGYNVGASLSQRETVLAFYFLIQSGKYVPGFLQEKIEEFIPQFVQEFKNIPDQVFETVKQSIINSKLEKNTSIADDANLLFYLAFDKDADFDRVSESILAAESLTKNDVIEILEKYLTTDHKGHLAIRIIGKSHTDIAAKGIEIKNIQSFKDNQLERSLN